MNIRLIFLDILIDLVSTWLTFLLFFVFWLICFQWTPTSSNYLMSDSTMWQKGSHRLREHPLAKQTPLRGIYSAKVACDLHLAPSTNKSISTSTITSGPWGSIVFGDIWTLEGASMTPHFHGADQPSLTFLMCVWLNHKRVCLVEHFHWTYLGFILIFKSCCYGRDFFRKQSRRWTF